MAALVVGGAASGSSYGEGDDVLGGGPMGMGGAMMDGEACMMGSVTMSPPRIACLHTHDQQP